MLTHLVIIGQTQSGKSLLAKSISSRVRNSGRSVLIYDPCSPASGPGVGGWSGHVLNDWQQFAGAFWASRGCLVIIDEAAEVSLEHTQELRRMLQRGRHVIDGGGGHVVCLVSQRYRIIDKSARDQASESFVFRCTPSDAAYLADEWMTPQLADAPRLPPLVYWHASRHGPPTLGRVPLPRKV